MLAKTNSAKALIIFASLILTSSAALSAQSESAQNISFSQTRIEMLVGDDMPLSVSNNFDHRMSFRVEIAEETIPAALEKLPKGFKHCGKGMNAYPKLFELGPGKSQTVKFLGRAEGHCRVNFYADKAKKQAKNVFANVSTAGNEIGISLDKNYRIGLAATVSK